MLRDEKSVFPHIPKLDRPFEPFQVRGIPSNAESWFKRPNHELLALVRRFHHNALTFTFLTR